MCFAGRNWCADLRWATTVLAMSFQVHLAAHIGLAFEKQRAAAKLLSGRAWQADLVARTITFEDPDGGDAIVIRAELIGLEDQASKAWQWATLPAGVELSEEALEPARSLLKWGAANDVVEFQYEAWEIGYLRTGTRTAMIATGVRPAAAFVSGSIDPKVPVDAYFLLHSPLLALGPVDLTTVARCVIDIAEQGHPVDHRSAVLHYLETRGMTVTQPMGRVVGTTPDGRRIRVMFNGRGMLSNVQGDFAIPEGIQVAR